MNEYSLAKDQIINKQYETTEDLEHEDAHSNIK